MKINSLHIRGRVRKNALRPPFLTFIPKRHRAKSRDDDEGSVCDDQTWAQGGERDSITIK